MEEEESNIILFPKEKIVSTHDSKLTLPQTIEEVKTNLSIIHYAYINELLELVLPQIANQLSAAGFNVGFGEDVKDSALFVESFRSLLCRQYGISHPLQKLAVDLFEEDADSSLRMVNSVDLKFYSETE